MQDCTIRASLSVTEKRGTENAFCGLRTTFYRSVLRFLFCRGCFEPVNLIASLAVNENVPNSKNNRPIRSARGKTRQTSDRKSTRPVKKNWGARELPPEIEYTRFSPPNRQCPAKPARRWREGHFSPATSRLLPPPALISLPPLRLTSPRPSSAAMDSSDPSLVSVPVGAAPSDWPDLAVGSAAGTAAPAPVPAPVPVPVP